MQGEYGKIEEIDGVLFCDGKRLSMILDLSKGRISQLTSSGVLLRDETEFGKLYNMDDAVQSYIEKLTNSDSAEDSKIRRDRAKAETSIKASKAIIANLEAQELKGRMFRTEDIQAITEQYYYEIRNMLNALPGQLATEVAGSDNPAECAVIIRTCVNRLLMNMQQYRFDISEYKERVHERMSWQSKDDSDGGEE